ncbi:MAG: GNAT family N-acetyltransferase [Burkholderiales bacterium]
MQTTLRAGRSEDMAQGGRIVYEAFKHISQRHNFPPDFPSVETAAGLLADLLSRTDVHAVVAERDGQVVGSNFLWEGDAIAGVGPITVDPASQDDSVGRKLMTAVLNRAAKRKFAGVRLVQAAYHNRSLALYTKLGFHAREPLSLMQGPALGMRLPGPSVRVAETSDLGQCNALAARVLGYDRAAELRHAIGQSTAKVTEHHGRVTGYATAIGFFGHAVAQFNDDLKALVASAAQISGPGLLLPTRNAELMRWCLEQGLRIVQPMTLMSMGEYAEPAGAWLPSVLY